jgi:hypothetical protein
MSVAWTAQLAQNMTDKPTIKNNPAFIFFSFF